MAEDVQGVAGAIGLLGLTSSCRRWPRLSAWSATRTRPGAAGAPEAALLHEHPEDPRRQLASERERLAGEPGREVVECIAGAQHDPSHTRGAGVADGRM